MKLFTPKRGAIDQITSALDTELVAEVLDVVPGIPADGMTLLMVTHAMRFASRVVFIHEGHIHKIGPPGKVFARPKTHRPID